MNKTKENNGFLFNLLLITIFFNIWFPKAGIKISGIPLTAGTLFFLILLMFWILKKCKSKTLSVPKPANLLLLGIGYFVLKYIIIGLKSGEILSYVTYIIPLIVYPLMFFISFDLVDSDIKRNIIIKIIVHGFYFICLYALLQFFVGVGNCDIPGLTVNYNDYKEMGPTWYMQKANGMSEDNSKVVSTYQNGNLFGINLLLIYPLVFMLFKEKGKNRQLYISLILFIACAFLTLSRTCWLGIILFIFFAIVLENEKTKSSIIRKMVIIMLCLLSICFVFTYMPSVVNRFTNTNKEDWIGMSGRSEGIQTLAKSISSNNNIFTWILAWFIGPNGIVQYSGLAFEMLPAALLAQTGIIGIILLYSFYINIRRYLGKEKWFEKAVSLSILIWLIVGCIECGYWLPPTALNIFAIIGIATSLKCREEIKND